VDVDKTYLPAQEAPARARTRFLKPYEYSWRSAGVEGSPCSGSQAPERVGLPVVVPVDADAQWGAA
jgi:hypothetical protein